jgi:hypothetical protein
VTVIVAMVRVVHNAAVTLLATSFGFMVASIVAHNTAGYVSWRDGMATTYIWTFFLALALYGLLAVLLAARGVANFIASRRAQP